MTLSDRDQIIGRAVRHCSHKLLKFPEEWVVNVYTYYAKKDKREDSSNDVTTDYLVEEEAFEREIASV